MEDRVVSLPYVDTQHDAMAVFDDVEQGVVLKEDIWVSGYRVGSTSVHGKVKVEFEEGGGSRLTSREGVKVQRVTKTNFSVSVPSLHIDSLPVRFPRQVIHPPYKKATAISAPLHINSLDYTSAGSGQLVLGGPDGYCVVLPAGPSASSQGVGAVELKGHLGDVLSTRWFPSGEVVLTTSSDLSIRIFSSKTGTNPRTLKGHTRAITSTHILGVGKEVLSGGKDGTVRLWNVGEGKEVRKWDTKRKRPVEDFVLAQREGEHGGGGLLIIATKEGIEGIPMNPEMQGQGWWVDAPEDAKGLVSIAYDPQREVLATGHTSGIVVLWVFAPSRLVTPLSGSEAEAQEEGEIGIERIGSFRRNESPIYSIRFTPEGDLLLGTAAGLPCRIGVEIGHREEGEDTLGVVKVKKVQVLEEYAGWEAVGVETWAVAEGGVWCAGGQGGLRRY